MYARPATALSTDALPHVLMRTARGGPPAHRPGVPRMATAFLFTNAGRRPTHARTRISHLPDGAGPPCAWFISRAHFGGRVDDSTGDLATNPRTCITSPNGHGLDREKGYAIPYRCLYSRNIDNLYAPGRNMSVTHEALGTVRVMQTLGMCGAAVGRAAFLCKKFDTTPRGVYEEHLDELKKTWSLPGNHREPH